MFSSFLLVMSQHASAIRRLRAAVALTDTELSEVVSSIPLHDAARLYRVLREELEVEGPVGGTVELPDDQSFRPPPVPILAEVAALHRDEVMRFGLSGGEPVLRLPVLSSDVSSVTLPVTTTVVSGGIDLNALDGFEEVMGTSLDSTVTTTLVSGSIDLNALDGSEEAINEVVSAEVSDNTHQGPISYGPAVVPVSVRRQLFCTVGQWGSARHPIAVARDAREGLALPPGFLPLRDVRYMTLPSVLLRHGHRLHGYCLHPCTGGCGYSCSRPVSTTTHKAHDCHLCRRCH